MRAKRAKFKVKEDVLVFVEEKFERRIAGAFSKVSDRITREISDVNERMAQNTISINERISAVDKRISDVRADIIRWMFIFWVGQIGVLVGLFLGFFKG